MKAMFPQSGGGDLMQQLRAHGREVALIAGAAVLLVALVVFRGAVRSEYRSLTGQAEPAPANDPAAVALARARARRQAMAKGATTAAVPAAAASKPGAKGTVVATASKAAPAQAGAPSKAAAAPGPVAAKTAAVPAPKVAAPNAAVPNAAVPNATMPNAAAPNAAPAAQAKVAASAQKRPMTAKDSASGGVMREVYGYVPDSRRDPFNSLLKTGDLRPTLGELRLLGILYDETGRHPVAILRDAANTQYRVTTGQQLGRMRVARIKRKAVVFTIEEFGMNRMDSLVLGDSTKARAK